MSENRFIFFHGYDALLWHGYEKNGLILPCLLKQETTV